MREIISGDCLDVMSRIENDSIDLIVTDPPYKIIAGGISLNENGDPISDGTSCSNKWLKRNETSIPSAMKQGTMFEHNDIKFSEWLPELFRVLKDGSHCYIMVNDRNVQEMLNEATKAGFKLLNILIWEKNNATPNKYYMKSAEFILFFRKGFAKSINNMGTKTVIKVNNIIGNKLHPSEKPVELFKILINNSSREGETVLDPFAGSGTTAIAALETNRNFICIEKDQQFFDIIVERVNCKENNQLDDLF